jgi:hypothetical protein
MPQRTPRRAVHAADRTDLLGRLSPVSSVLARVAALAGVAAIGSAVLTATATQDSGVAPAAARAAAPAAGADHHPGSRAMARAEARPPVKASAPAAHHSRPARHPSGDAGKSAKSTQPKHWLPSGTGMWLYQWHESNGGDASSIVARARRVGLDTL